MPASNHSALPWVGKDPKFTPKQRIFLSVDIIGSTEIKSTLAKQESQKNKWANEFMRCLPEISVIYWMNYTRRVKEFCKVELCPKCCIPVVGKTPDGSFPRPKVWKYIGDEVVLVSELICEKPQPAIHILSLADTITQINNRAGTSDTSDSNKDSTFSIKVKGAAWVAGFPVANIEVDLPVTKEPEDKNEDRTKSDSTKQDDLLKDFLGSSMDLGFRMSKFATEERLILSSSLAYLASRCDPFKKEFTVSDITEIALPLCCGGFVPVKGVKAERHPLIWVPLKKSNENGLCSINRDELARFLETDVFEGKDENLPFILNEHIKPDPEYISAYKKAIDEQEKIPNSIFYEQVWEEANSNTLSNSIHSGSTPLADESQNGSIPQGDIDALLTNLPKQKSNKAKSKKKKTRSKKK